MFHLTLRSSFSQSLTHKAAIFPSLFTGVFEKDMPGVWFIFDSYICSRHGLEISGAFSELAHVLVLSLSALYMFLQLFQLQTLSTKTLLFPQVSHTVENPALVD